MDTLRKRFKNQAADPTIAEQLQELQKWDFDADTIDLFECKFVDDVARFLLNLTLRI
jgi:hypothetical protein